MGTSSLLEWSPHSYRSGLTCVCPGSAAGRWIGYLERTLILALLLSGNPAGVGFVFAGKAIARFSERKQVEYYLLGTFASFTWATVLALLYLALP